MKTLEAFYRLERAEELFDFIFYNDLLDCM